MIPSLTPIEGARILVTGGAGFVGSCTVEELIVHGAEEVIVIDDMVRGRPENLSSALSTGRVRLIDGDICNSELVRTQLEGVDLVFHLAALRITQCAAEPRRAMQVMVDATYDLLDLCVAAGVGKVIMASSASVYGMASSFPTGEAHPPYANRTLYGAAKTFGEQLLRAFKEMYGLDYVALRYFNAYGPRMDIHGRYTEVLIRWMERAEAGLAPVVFGDGSETMDMVHVDDIARANLLAAVSPATDVALNVGSGTETSLAELARRLAEAMGREDLVPIHEPPRAVNPVPKRLADLTLARELIGYEPTIPLDKGLAQLVAWWRSERRGAPASVPERAA
ncbi:MAG TPA: NAD-dependent epimerase/dehydratase family protein [Caulobacteraceae bacterium]|nr:NAD-dependent epimerase/dehydratase family protein [Caulobacteraceae bacterium]